MDQATLEKINHLVSPSELYVGYELIILEQANQPPWTSRANLGQGETMLELAVKGDSDPWTVAQINGLASTLGWFTRGYTLSARRELEAAPSGLPAALVSAQVDPLPLSQGMTAQIKVVSTQAVKLGGLLVDHPLHFFPTDANTQVALQGIYAALDPGLYPLRIDVTGADGSVQSFQQMVLVNSGNFPTDPGLEVDPATIDPAVTGPEDQWLLSLTSVLTPEKYWNGVFQLPVGTPSCIRAGFGDRRSYNGGVFKTFTPGSITVSVRPPIRWTSMRRQTGWWSLPGSRRCVGMPRSSMMAREFLPVTITNQNSSFPSGTTSRPGN